MPYVSSVLNRMALSALVGAVPPTMVDEVLRATGIAAERVRSLPPWVTTYHVLGSAMCPSTGYDDVTDLMWTTLPAAAGRGLSRERPTRGAITRARSRLGAEPLRLLLRQTLRAVPASRPEQAVTLHRFEIAGAHGLWWIADPDTGALRGCDVRGADLDTAAALVRSASVTHVTVGLPAEEATALQRRLGPEVSVASGPSAAVDGTLWLGLRARTRVAWEQDALARACVSAALERALATARAVPPQH